MISYSEFRARGRYTLGNNIFAPEWLYPMLVCMLISAIYSVSAYFGIVAVIIYGPLYLGQASYFISMTRRWSRPSDLSVAFDGFKVDVGGTIITGILIILYTFLWSLLLIVPGIIKSLSYSMTFYIKRDHPEYTATEAICASRELMNGNKGRLFLLRLSFVGWILLTAIFTLGIGLFWVIPYMQATDAAFYEQICREKGGRFVSHLQTPPFNGYGGQYPPYGGQPPYGSQPPYGGQPPYGNQPPYGGNDRPEDTDSSNGSENE